jgi:hypothetical protein
VNRQHHVLFGAVAGLGCSAARGMPAWQCLISAGLGSLVGPMPDVDSRRWWKRLDRLMLPDEWLGAVVVAAAPGSDALVGAAGHGMGGGGA